MTQHIRVGVETHWVGASVEWEEDLPDDWDIMDQEEREQYLSDMAEETLNQYASGYAFVEDK